MEFATAGLSTLLPKLAKLLQDEYKLHKGAKKGIEFLHKELKTMHAVLRKLDEVPWEQLDELQRIWAGDVRELSYDMEDIVDTFVVRVQGAGPPSKKSAKRFIKKMTNMATKAKALRDVSKEIQSIKERVKDVADRRDRFNLDAITATAKKTHVDPRITSLYAKVTELVGIGEAKEEVITRLTKGYNADQQERIVVSIAGFGGLGKTTLAKAVYDEIKKDFSCTAFVSVSRTPDTQKLLKDMLYQLDKENFMNIHSKMLDERLLIDETIEFLQNKRYLIVIDDIWDKEPWDKVIGLSLIENKMRSRIITTTRNIDVAEHVGGCYRLKPLPKKSSEMLFYGRIFGSQDNCPRQFVEVSEKVLKKCGGVPLAIITTASLLAKKSNIKVWNDVCDSFGLGLGRNDPGIEDMRKILLLSYYDLPSPLKTCLLYLSVFPEDYEIRKDNLIWRWIAEGFVQQGDQISFHETGENYFNELLNRSLVQPADMEYCVEGIPKACRLHDSVLDLIITLSVEECFITTVLGDGMENKVRWLSLHSSNTNCPTMEMPKLRSLTILRGPNDGAIDLSLSRYHLLRVLDLQGNIIKSLESHGCIGSLTHLRYLGLSTINNIMLHGGYDKLPVEIGKLRFLQTLDIYDTVVVELPSSVVAGLGQLMCLRGKSAWRTNMPVGLKNLTSLEVLQQAVVRSEYVVEELGHLTKLRILDVTITVECADAVVKSLGKLYKIESLNICGFGHSLDGTMEKPLGNMCRLSIIAATYIPTWIKQALLPSLSYLYIDVENERREDIQVLGMLPCLRYLKFEVKDFVTKQEEKEPLEWWCVVRPDAFPRVVRCEFHTLTAVAPSMFPVGAMPMVQDLAFRMGRRKQFGRRGSFSVDDLGLGHLPSLQRVAALGLEDFKFDDEAITEKVIRSVKEKLEHEADVHPKNPTIYWKEFDHCGWYLSY